MLSVLFIRKIIPKFVRVSHIDSDMKGLFKLQYRLLYVIVATLLVMCGCTEDPEPVAVTSVTLDSTSLTLIEGDTKKLTATILPSNAENKKLAWLSSNSSVATVNDGVVKAIKSGNATITVKTDDGGKTATCDVIVNPKVYPVTGVTLDQTSVEMTEGDEVVLIATVTPANATNSDVSWNSSNTSVATVSDGKVTAISAGTSIITVSTDDGGKTATCEVKVSAMVYPVTGVTLDQTSVEMTLGDEVTLIATVNPDNATNKNVIWSSSNPTVANVVDGKITATNVGKATITVMSEDARKSASCNVVVKAKVYQVTGVTLDKTSYEITEGEEYVLTAAVHPANATNKNVLWTSSNPEVAIVSGGKINALDPGVAVITVITEDGGYSASCEVNVRKLDYQGVYITLGQRTVEVTEGDELYLSATVKPSSAINKTIIWTSSDTSIAYVNDGYLYAVKEGTAIVSATAEDGGYTTTCLATVHKKGHGVDVGDWGDNGEDNGGVAN